MRGFGVVLLLAGLFGMVGAFFMPVTVPDGLSDVVNADALALRSMISNTAGFATVAGAVMACLWPEPSTGAPKPDAEAETPDPV